METVGSTGAKPSRDNGLGITFSELPENPSAYVVRTRMSSSEPSSGDPESHPRPDVRTTSLLGDHRPGALAETRHLPRSTHVRSAWSRTRDVAHTRRSRG